MKVLKSILLVIAGLFTSVVLHAQEIKTLELKRQEMKLPPAPAAPVEIPVTAFIPMNGVAPKASPHLETETPSPYTKDKNDKPSKPVSTIIEEKPLELTLETKTK